MRSHKETRKQDSLQLFTINRGGRYELFLVGVLKTQAEVLLDVRWNCSQRRKALLFRFHGYLILRSLGRGPASFQRAAVINSGYHHRTSADTTRFPASAFGFLRSIIFGNRWGCGGGAEPAFTVRPAMSAARGRSGNDRVVHVTGLTRPRSIHRRARSRYATSGGREGGGASSWGLKIVIPESRV